MNKNPNDYNWQEVWYGAPDGLLQDHVEDVVAVWESNIGDEDGCGGEWSGVAVYKLRNGQFISGSGWCDYTGWGCQDGTTWTTSGTLEEVLAQITVEERRLLGFEPPIEHGDIWRS